MFVFSAFSTKRNPVEKIKYGFPANDFGHCPFESWAELIYLNIELLPEIEFMTVFCKKLTNSLIIFLAFNWMESYWVISYGGYSMESSSNQQEITIQIAKMTRRKEVER